MGKTKNSGETPNKVKKHDKNTKVKRCKKEKGDDQTVGPEDELLENKLFKNGQKYLTPPVGDGTRGFYESLLEENPHSPIAIKFCLENGILEGNKHEEMHTLYTKLLNKGVFKGPIGGLKLQAQNILK